MLNKTFNIFKIRFDKLNELGLPAIVDKTKTSIVFIDLEMVFPVLFSKQIDTFARACNNDTRVKILMMAGIINLALHYKLYFEKLGVDNRVVMVWNYKDFDFNNKSVIPTYRSTYTTLLDRNPDTRYIGECLNSIYDYTHLIFLYLDRCYLLDDGHIESGVMPHLIEKETYKDCQYFIVGRSEYYFQYIPKGYTMIYPSTNSEIISMDNISDILLKKHKLSTNKNKVPIDLLPFIISLLGDKWRGIPSINRVGLGAILKNINTAIDNVLITPNISNPELFSRILSERYLSTFMSNYKVTSANYQYMQMSEVDKLSIKSFIEDKYDDNTLIDINDKYFSEICPILNVESRRRRMWRIINNV